MSPRKTVTKTPFPSDDRIILAPSPGFNLPPRPWDTKEVKVLHLPATDSPPTSHVILTTKIEKPCTHDEKTEENEEWVKHVPNIGDFQGCKFDWDSRILAILELEDSEAPKESKGWWFMYKCKDDASAFVFRGRKGCDQLGRMIYEKDWSDPKEEIMKPIFDTLAKLSYRKG